MLVYPHNFLDRNMGTNIRVYSLAKVLRERGYALDLYACRNMFSSFDRWDEMNAEERLVDKCYLYDFRQTQRYRKKNRLKSRVNKLLRREELETWVTPCMLSQFRQIVSSTSYDYIVMFYAYTAELLSPAHYAGNACKVYFMEDFLSMNQYAAGASKRIGPMLDSELTRVGYFDKIACISWDEKIFFEKLLTDKRFYFLPHVIEESGKGLAKTVRSKKVLFVGAVNVFNIEGVQWFLKEVYPRLDAGADITIAGKVTDCIGSVSLPNVHVKGYVESLDDLYAEADVVICPLRNGTGMKIKVVEAMSHGIPVVCTSRGVDGLPDKTRNGCLVSDTAEGFAANINRLLTDNAFYKECQENVRRYFSEVLDWSVNKETISEIFRR